MSETTTTVTWTGEAYFWFGFRGSDKPFALVGLDTAGHYNVLDAANGVLLQTAPTLDEAKAWAEEHL